MTEPEEYEQKTRKTDEVLFSPDGDPHHKPSQTPRPDEHLPVTFTHDGETEIVGEDG
jgi:hypothetical protein